MHRCELRTDEQENRKQPLTLFRLAAGTGFSFFENQDPPHGFASPAPFPPAGSLLPVLFLFHCSSMDCLLVLLSFCRAAKFLSSSCLSDFRFFLSCLIFFLAATSFLLSEKTPPMPGRVAAGFKNLLRKRCEKITWLARNKYKSIKYETI